MPMKTKYEDDVTQNHIMSNSEMFEEIMQRQEDFYKAYPLLQNLEKVNQSFKEVYEIFDKSDELLKKGQARNSDEEAALASLRFEMEHLFYKIKSVYPKRDLFEQGIIFDGMKYLVSICINIPEIMYYRAKEDIFEYAVKNNLLEK